MTSSRGRGSSHSRKRDYTGKRIVSDSSTSSGSQPLQQRSSTPSSSQGQNSMNAPSHGETSRAPPSRPQPLRPSPSQPIPGSNLQQPEEEFHPLFHHPPQQQQNNHANYQPPLVNPNFQAQIHHPPPPQPNLPQVNPVVNPQPNHPQVNQVVNPVVNPQPNLQQQNNQQAHLTLEALLAMERDIPRLSPILGEGLWFDRDEKELVKKVAKIIKDKFEGPFYNWLITPTWKRDQYFTQLAYHYTWDPVITPLVQEEFNAIAQRRLKGLISTVRSTRKRPRWITDTLWVILEAYWETDEAKEKSLNASNCRNSDRDGLGPHKHLGGPRSFAQIRRDMEVELGRPVTLGEVFVKTHTIEDGMYCDEKARLIAEAYDKNLKQKMDDAGTGPSEVSDGTSKLTPDECDEVFLISTIPDERGNPYGLGRLSLTHGKGKEKCSSSATITDLQDQLKAARKMIEDQEVENRRRDQELAEARRSKSEFDTLISYLKDKDPALAALMASRTTQAEPAIHETGSTSGAHGTTPP